MGIIKNYGLFWERDLVGWGRGNVRGTLGGRQRRQKGRIVDFREQAGVYVLYEGESIATHRISYVGQAGVGNANLYNRLNRHRRDHLWNRWQRFSWFGLYDVGVRDQLIRANPERRLHIQTSDIMNHVEGLLIALFEPPLNKQGPRFGRRGVFEYLQVPPDE